MTDTATRATGGEADHPLALPFASVGRRAAAVLVDTIVLFGIGWVVAWATGDAHGLGYTIRGWKAVLAVVIFALYCIGMEARVGATGGKLLLGLRVVDEHGRRIDLASSTIRNILRIVDSLLGYLVGAVLIWRSPRRQRLGDRAAGTFVVLSASTARRLETVADVEGGMFTAFPEGCLVVRDSEGGLGVEQVRRKRQAAVGLAVGAGAVAGVIAIMAPAGDTLDAGAVERFVAREFAERGAPVSDVRCPPGLRLRARDAFTCTAALDGKTLRVQITQTDDDGSFTATSLDAIIPITRMEATLTRSIADKAGRAVTVNCSDEEFLVAAPGTSFSCDGTFAGLGRRPIHITVKDAAGNVDFHIPLQ